VAGIVVERDRKDLGRTGDTQRLRKPDLSLEDAVADDPRGAQAIPAAKPEDGHNPYDTFPSIRQPDAARRQTDLRRLSEWIRLKRQIEVLKKNDGEDTGK
jgi:hypothetical protein